MPPCALVCWPDDDLDVPSPAQFRARRCAQRPFVRSDYGLLNRDVQRRFVGPLKFNCDRPRSACVSADVCCAGSGSGASLGVEQAKTPCLSAPRLRAPSGIGMSCRPPRRSSCDVTRTPASGDRASQGNVSDFEATRKFLVAALAPLGIGIVRGGEGWAMLGRGGRGQFWFGAYGPSPGPTHVAFAAETREQVRQFHACAIEAGGRDNGAPGVEFFVASPTSSPRVCDRRASTTSLSQSTSADGPSRRSGLIIDGRQPVANPSATIPRCCGCRSRIAARKGPTSSGASTFFACSPSHASSNSGGQRRRRLRPRSSRPAAPGGERDRKQ